MVAAILAAQVTGRSERVSRPCQRLVPAPGLGLGPLHGLELELGLGMCRMKHHELSMDYVET